MLLILIIQYDGKISTMLIMRTSQAIFIHIKSVTLKLFQTTGAFDAPDWEEYSCVFRKFASFSGNKRKGFWLFIYPDVTFWFKSRF